MNPFPERSRRLATWLAAALTGSMLLASPIAAAEEDSAKASTPKPVEPAFRQAIRDYVEIQGSAELMGQSIAYGMAEQALQAIAQTGAQITEPMQQIVLDQALTSFGKKYSDVDYLTDLWAPIYAQHFTVEEIRELVAFYRSPIGRKTIELMVPITQAGNEALQKAAYSDVPGFQLAVDAKLREAGLTAAP